MTSVDDENHLPSDPSQSVTNKPGSKIFSEKYFKDPTLIIILAAYAIIIQLFYTTDFRKSLENFFFDIRINWMPVASTSSNVFVIKIDDDSIQRLEKDPIRVRVDGQKRPYLNTSRLTKAASILANTEARAIALLMPENAFPAADIDMNELALLAKYDQRILIGTLGYNQTIPNLSKLPPPLLQIENQVAGYETFRSRSNAIVRSLPFTSFRGLSEVETLAPKVAEIADPDFTALYGTFTLKSIPPDSFGSVSIADFMEHPTEWMNAVKNKVVIVGYTVSRDAGFQTTDQLMVHTPLTGFSPTLTHGISTTWLVANAVDNLLSRETLRPAPEAITLLQTLGVAVICGALWQWGSLVASLATIFCWLLLLTTHATLYRWQSISIPMADTFLATTLITVLAAVRRVRLELISMAEQTAKTDVKSQIANVQSHFLSGFAQWLKSMTVSISQKMKLSADLSHAGRKTGERTDHQPSDLFQRAFAASDDFQEYLEAINQLPQLEALKERSIKKDYVDIQQLLDTIIRRFAFKIEARSLKCSIEIAPDADVVKTNRQLLDAILFNLISNAIKYGPDGGEIIIKSARISRKKVTISISDEGPGIPTELQDRIFERFYRILDDRMYKAKGTGLGLFLCKYFAERLGGGITVTSDGKLGSNFTVVLPL